MKRFPSFPEQQARELKAECDRLWRRWLQMTIILALFTAGGYAFGLYVNQQQTNRAHALAKDTCLRSQDGRRALQALVAIAIPLDAPGRSAAEQKAVDGFYYKINHSKALKVPKC